MLTNKELLYVTANRPPYPGDVYSLSVLNNLKDSIELYEEYYKGKEYDITFSNGEDISFEIAQSNLAHILGLQFAKLKKIPEFSELNTYKILERIIDNPKEILDINKRENFSAFNFYRINVRSLVFSKFSNFSDLNFGCIRYDNSLLSDDMETTLKSDTFLFTESDEMNSPYYMMGLAVGDKNDRYVETLFPDLHPEKMFKNQTIVVPTSVSITTLEDYNHIDATSKNKLDLLKRLSQDLKQYDCKFDIFSDYISELSTNATRDSRMKSKK